jgi:uncharacterized protein YqgC (DUF456 family)
VNAFGLVLVALAIAVGLVGIVVPLLPGTLLIFGAIAVWAAVEHTLASWVVLGVVTAVLGASILTKYLWPMRRMRAAEVGRWSLAVGAILAVIGFFVVPVAGLALGFVLGIFLAECFVRRDRRLAWVSTVQAIKALALAAGVELVGGLIAATIWLVAL